MLFFCLLFVLHGLASGAPQPGEPEYTTEDPYHTTKKPYHTTEKPYHTTKKPSHTTEKPYYTEKPVYPITGYPQPVYPQVLPYAGGLLASLAPSLAAPAIDWDQVDSLVNAINVLIGEGVSPDGPIVSQLRKYLAQLISSPVPTIRQPRFNGPNPASLLHFLSSLSPECGGHSNGLAVFLNQATTGLRALTMALNFGRPLGQNDVVTLTHFLLQKSQELNFQNPCPSSPGNPLNSAVAGFLDEAVEKLCPAPTACAALGTTSPTNDPYTTFTATMATSRNKDLANIINQARNAMNAAVGGSPGGGLANFFSTLSDQLGRLSHHPASVSFASFLVQLAVTLR